MASIDTIQCHYRYVTSNGCPMSLCMTWKPLWLSSHHITSRRLRSHRTSHLKSLQVYIHTLFVALSLFLHSYSVCLCLCALNLNQSFHPIFVEFLMYCNVLSIVYHQFFALMQNKHTHVSAFVSHENWCRRPALHLRLCVDKEVVGLSPSLYRLIDLIFAQFPANTEMLLRQNLLRADCDYCCWLLCSNTATVDVVDLYFGIAIFGSRRQCEKW